MRNVSKPVIGLLFSLLLFSCHREESEKKNIRNKWYEYFLAFVEAQNVGIGTDSTYIDFQNHSPYKVDSAFMMFHNNGLFVNSFDSIVARNVPPGGSVKIQVPKHALGVSRSVSFLSIYSKELEFCFHPTKDKDPDNDDPYYCK